METVWPAKPKLFTFGTLQKKKKIADPCPSMTAGLLSELPAGRWGPGKVRSSTSSSYPQFTSALWRSRSSASAARSPCRVCSSDSGESAGANTCCRHCPSSPSLPRDLPPQEAAVTDALPTSCPLVSGWCLSVIFPFLKIFLFIRQRAVSGGKTWTGLACSSTICL